MPIIPCSKLAAYTEETAHKNSKVLLLQIPFHEVLLLSHAMPVPSQHETDMMNLSKVS